IKKLHDNLRKVYKKYTPLVIKIAPDISIDTISELSILIDKYEVDGVICTNTTIDKSEISEKYNNIQGGLSGKPLLIKSNEILKQVNNKISKDKTIIGVGGIDSWESANEKFKNGANLIQLYTGLVYKGPSVIRDILKY
ncbi:MAG: quinone-dependent dihydroorotate dehydrogenase, partial [Gammaproteobacteria bacterium]